ncbi:MAG TPA: cation diffusion facilitator family transporter [Candidatus Polarisedimenticolia bacterium]|nr:cation diffusion facilitator family transporter [Candidatus Polarisedimenticolia bacterium]
MNVQHQELPLEQYGQGQRATRMGLAVNLTLALGKLGAGIVGRSHALIADATESLGDVFGSVIVWRGLQIASRPPDPEHPYGHGKAEPIAAALVAVLLLMAGVGIAIQSIHEIRTPREGPAAFTLVVLLVVIAIKEGLFQRLHHVGKRIGSAAVHTDAWHHRSDAITSAVAAIGIAVAIIGGKGYEAADDWAALFASGVILFTGMRLLRPATEELMDRSPEPSLVERATEVAERQEGVHRVEKLLMRKMGLYYVADMHLEVDPHMTVFRGHEISHEVKEAVRAAFPRIVELTIHVEPARPGTPSAREERRKSNS